MKKINVKSILLVIGAAAGIALVLYLSLSKKGPSVKKRSVEESREMRSMQLVLNGGQGFDFTNYPTDIESALKALKRKNFIRDVVIEKNVVCAGEDFEVRVVMDNPDGPDSDLMCRLGGQFSTVAVFNYFEPGNQSIDIYVRDRQGNVDFRSLDVTVNDCPGKAALIIDADQSDRVADEIEFAIIEKRGITCPCTYEWDFGDGTVHNTPEENIAHNYANRPQDTYSSTFIVSVKAVDKDGKKAASRTSMTLTNVRFVSKQVGFAVVPIIYDTRPEFVDNAYSIRATIKNMYDDPITFKEAVIVIKRMATGEIVKQETVSAGSIMKKLTVNNGEIVEDTVSIPSRLIPASGDVIQITIIGVFTDNTPGKGIIFIFRE